jgi:hypothetical protein
MGWPCSMYEEVEEWKKSTGGKGRRKETARKV